MGAKFIHGMEKRCLPSISRGFMLALMLAIQGCGETALSNPTELVEKAKQRIEAGDDKAAVIHLKNLLKIDPEYPESRKLLGQVYVALGRINDAESELNKAISIDPEDFEARLLLSDIYLSSNKIELLEKTLDSESEWPAELLGELYSQKALATLNLGNLVEARKLQERAEDVDATSPNVKFSQAIFLMVDEDLLGAKDLLNAVIKDGIDEEVSIKALILRGNINARLKDYSAAVEDYTIALSKKSNNIAVRLGLARIYAAMNEVDKAEIEIRKVLKKHADNPAANFLLAYMSAEKQDNQAVLTYAEKVLLSNENHVETHRLVAFAAFNIEQYEKSYKHVQKVISSSSVSVDDRKLKAAIELKLGLVNEAIDSISSIDESLFLPGDAELLVEAGRASLLNAKYEISKSLLTKAEKLKPFGEIGVLSMSSVEMLEGGYSEGINTLLGAVKATPESFNIRANLILRYLDNKDYSKAISESRVLQEMFPDKPSGFILEGIANILNKDTAAAKVLLQKALSIAPGDLNASHNLAVIAMMDADASKAREVYLQVLKHHPGNMKAYIYLIQIEIYRGDIAAANRLLSEALKHNPESLPVAFLAIKLALSQNDANKAMDVARQFSAIYPENTDLKVMKGHALRMLGDYDKAIVEYSLVSEANPGNKMALFLLADTLEKMGDLQRAISVVDRALKIDPNFAEGLLVKGRIKLKTEGPDAVKSILDILKEKAANVEVVKELEAQVLLLNGENDKALSMFRDVFNSRQTSPVLIQLASAMWINNHVDELFILLEEWLVRYPTDQAVRSTAAQYFMMSSDYSRAETHLEQLVDVNSNNVWAVNSLAWVYHQHGKLEMALKQALNAFKLSPENPEILDTLGMIYLDLGRISDAAPLLRQAADLHPENLEIQYHLAMLNIEKGQKSEAISLLKKALGTNKGFFPSRQQAELLLSKIDTRTNG